MLDFTLGMSGLVWGIVAIVAGIVVLAFPRILNYLIGVYMIISGILWLLGGAWIPGILSLVVGIIVMIFPTILNYLLAAYLILLGFWYIFIGGALVLGIQICFPP
jgi:uncharacterized membrane protein HdeD (DUF308 family)